MGSRAGHFGAPVSFVSGKANPHGLPTLISLGAGEDQHFTKEIT